MPDECNGNEIRFNSHIVSIWIAMGAMLLTAVISFTFMVKYKTPIYPQAP